MSYPVISLFSGAMGLDLGLEKAGLEVKITQELDQWCIKTINSNGYKCATGDIRRLIYEDPNCNFLLKPANLSPGEPFLVAGGPPCQSFSTAGRRLGINDPRGSLFREFIHVIKTVKPRFFIMENVKGLTSISITQSSSGQSPFDSNKSPGSLFRYIQKEFADLGYAITSSVLDAVHYGVPQFRERLIIIGSRDQENIFLPKPTHFRHHQAPEYRWRTLRSAISDLENVPEPCAKFSQDRLYYLKQVPMGGNWRNINSDEVVAAMGGAFKSGGGKVGFYRRLDYDQPSPTLVTSPVQKATMLCHPTQDRPLSIREYMRIQQFPDDWIIDGSITECYKQIGNAVPIGLGKALGESIIAAAEDNAEVKVKRVRGTSVHKKYDNLNHYQANLFNFKEEVE